MSQKKTAAERQETRRAYKRHRYLELKQSRQPAPIQTFKQIFLSIPLPVEGSLTTWRAVVRRSL